MRKYFSIFHVPEGGRSTWVRFICRVLRPRSERAVVAFSLGIMVVWLLVLNLGQTGILKMLRSDDHATNVRLAREHGNFLHFFQGGQLSQPVNRYIKGGDNLHERFNESDPFRQYKKPKRDRKYWRKYGRFWVKLFPAEEYLKPHMDVFTLKENRIITSIPKPEPSIAVGVCKDNAPYLLCFIPSLPKKTISRATIRQTWGEAARGMDWPGKPLRHRVALVFVFGTADYTAEEMEIVRNESRQYGDVLASNMIDSYANLTLKMLVAMQWAVTSCPEFQFLLKADEDTFVNLSLLMDLLTELMDGGHTSFILGYNHLQHKPATSRQGRWNVSRRVYSLDDFPRYVYGHSYVTSADVLPSMLYLAQRMPYFPPEDAFLTGVLAVALNVTRIHSQRFAVAFRTMYTCDMLTERYLSVTPVTERQMHSIYDSFRTGTCDPSELIKAHNSPLSRIR